VTTSKRTILIVVLILAQACSAKPTRNTAKQKRAKALKLLDKYAETQDKLQRSFIVKFETSTKFNYRTRSSKRSGEAHKLYEMRFDGDRTSVRLQQK